MSEMYPGDDDLNALSGTVDAQQEVPYIPAGQSPYHTSFYAMQQRLLDVARRAGDLRVYKDGELTFGVRAGQFSDGAAVLCFAGTSGQLLENNQPNHVYLDAAGQLLVSTAGFPQAGATPHIPLAIITTAMGTYGRDGIIDCRGRAIFGVCTGLSAQLANRAAGFFGSTDITGSQASALVGGANADGLHVHAAAAIGLKNACLVAAGDDVVAAYAWLRSSARDVEFGPRSADNRRVLVLGPGRHDVPATIVLDADFVDIHALAAGDPRATVLYFAGGAGAGPTLGQAAADISLCGFTIENGGAAAGNHALLIAGRVLSAGVCDVADATVTSPAGLGMAGQLLRLSGGSPAVNAGTYHLVEDGSGILDRAAGAGQSAGVSYQLIDSNRPSVYRRMRFVAHGGGHAAASGVSSECTLMGDWQGCIGENFCWRAGAEMWLWAQMSDITCGSGCLAADAGAQVRGTYRRVIAGDGCFGGEIAGRLSDCELSGLSAPLRLASARMDGCRVSSVAAQACVELLDSGSSILSCTLLAGGSQTVQSAAPQSAAIAACLMNAPLAATVTSTISAGGNIVDAALS